MTTTVTPETYIRAEVDGRFAVFQQRAGGRINAFYLIERPVPTDEQPVVRMNRDTLYGGGVIDTAEGARVYVPEVADGRYVSLMVIDNDHYTVDVLHEPGWHEITSPTRYCVAVPRVELHDMRDEEEIAHVVEVLHRFRIEAGSAETFVPADWDYDSMFALRAEYEKEFRTYGQYPSGWMGRRGEVDEATRHLAVAGAWGLFPEQEAVYINYTGPADASKGYVATYSVPPCDAFWSIAVYGDDAFFHSDVATLSPATTQYNDDGTFTVYFGSADVVGDKPNRLDITDGWNFLFRVYRPHASVLAREYTLPDVVEVTG
ncbi:DUF1214 domain-containing protein [Cellulosimicrobium marinum]|uniref:DUF1214 domain-containing protein n=1 Tax=Cellulosimicrobium marinum TaxID=1638992 RepID=UPI001E600143|nr:DUF1214 domain-containing protein [Cellulosimicrobium marinum]MCB7135855.1 DUF1214 domain-containing protein [Cellulosimicrobium marinum]